jgi:hypothetical protein
LIRFVTSSSHFRKKMSKKRLTVVTKFGVPQRFATSLAALNATIAARVVATNSEKGLAITGTRSFGDNSRLASSV